MNQYLHHGLSPTPCLRFLTRLQLVVALLVVLLLLVGLSPVEASTSSTLLKHAVKATSSAAGSSTARAATHQLLGASKASTSAASLARTALPRHGVKFLRNQRGAVAGAAISAAATSSTASTVFCSSATATATAGRAVTQHAQNRAVCSFRPLASTTAKVGHRAATVKLGSSATALPFTRTATGSANRLATSSGFRRFSQRATRLQTRLQKSFSLRAIVSDVITNRPGSSSSTSKRTASDDFHQSLSPSQTSSFITRQPRPLLQDLQHIAAGTMAESWSGFVGGYLLGAGTDVTRRVYRQIVKTMTTRPVAAGYAGAVTTATSSIVPYADTLMRHSQHLQQFHTRSWHYGMEWAQMAAVFGACRLVVQHARPNKPDDEWNSVGGSALAGAVFACLPTRTLPVPAMVRGMALYGGTMWLLHPTLWRPSLNTLQLTSPQPPSQQQSPQNKESWWDGME